VGVEVEEKRYIVAAVDDDSALQRAQLQLRTVREKDRKKTVSLSLCVYTPIGLFVCAVLFCSFCVVAVVYLWCDLSVV
jgi:hypothetical protein